MLQVHASGEWEDSDCTLTVVNQGCDDHFVVSARFYETADYGFSLIGTKNDNLVFLQLSRKM